jgi:hypothetical protein
MKIGWKKGLVLGAAAVVVLMGAAVAVLLLVEWDAPELGNRVLRRVGEQGGLTLEAQGFRLNLLRGLELQRAQARGELPAGALTAEADRLVLRHRLGPLLRGEVVIDEVVLTAPRLELLGGEGAAPGSPGTTGPAAAGEGPGPEADTGTGRAVTVHRFEIVDGDFTLRTAGVPESTTAFRGLDLVLRDLVIDPGAPGLVGVSAQGELAAREVVLGTVTAREAASRVRLEAGRLVMSDLVFTTDQGPLRFAELAVGLARDPFDYRFDALGEPLEISALLGAPGGSLGTVRLELSGGGVGAEVGGLHADGRITLSAGRLPRAPFIEQLERLLDRPLAGEPYFETTLPFEIERGRIGFEPFRLATAELELGASGWVGLDGGVGLRLEARLPAAGLDIEEIPQEALAALTDERGWVEIPLVLGGTFAAPRLGPDQQVLRQVARQAVRQRAQDEIRHQLDKLLGGRRKP